MSKKTKQGVRDLNDLPSKPRGVKLEMPPSEALVCDHPLEARLEHSLSGGSKCKGCGQMWDFDGNPY